MSTTSGQLKPEPRVEDVATAVKYHKRLAPKIWSRAECKNQYLAKDSDAMVTIQPVSHERSTSPSIEQQQKMPLSPGFEFINTTTNRQYSGRGSRSMARSHVMRNFHRSRKKGKPKLEQPNLRRLGASRSLTVTAQAQLKSSKSESSSRPLNLDDTRLYWPDQENMHDVRYLEKAGGVNHDSAMSLHKLRRQERRGGYGELSMSNLWALPVSAHATELIHHYIQIFAKSFVPMKQTWESEWFTNTLSDPACFHGTMFLAVAHKALLTGTDKSLPVESLYHKCEAIRIINERLSDSESRITDGTIAAIACLASFETLSGIVTDASMHIDGLEKLVSMRGGLKKLGMDGFLEQFLYWVDLSNATATRKKPRFLPFEPPPVYPTYVESEALWRYCDSQWNEDLLGHLPEKPYPGMDVVENRLFHRLRQITNLVASNPTIANGPNQQEYANAVLLLERQVGVAVQERLAFKKRFGAVSLSPPTCLFYIPALIFCYMILRPIPVRSSIYEPLVERMKTHIDQMKPRQLFDRFQPEFWFWALLFVGAASMGRAQQSYFQHAMAQLCGLLDVRSWAGAKAIAKEFAWADSTCERPCKAFWDTLEGVDGRWMEEEVDIIELLRKQIFAT